MQTLIDEETTILLDLENEQPIMCESYYENVEKGLPAHTANWYASSVCGCLVIAVCENRRHLAYINDGWRCVPEGCGKLHHYDELFFSPIK